MLPDQLQRWPRVTTAIWHQAAYVSATPAGNQSAGPSFDEAQAGEVDYACYSRTDLALLGLGRNAQRTDAIQFAEVNGCDSERFNRIE